ncbi:zf-RVT domain-containing protein [Cephalotus follicularis]|uniref:Zf-RVT domain-containing protein n=1 Tax=Cephalotus follicularis TaxID=3775 RepID=A0A1Q3BGM3_CEPFO|nr:zf-RVT domain-containing protein [Cephalotus follicularis]
MIREAWYAITPQSSTVEWWKIGWFPRSIPKHCFCIWLTFCEAHRTLNKMVRWGLVPINRCEFICGQGESIDHFFFECTFIARIWNHFLLLYRFRRRPSGWHVESEWCSQRLKGNDFKSWLTKLTLAAVIYHSWQERNNRLYNNFVRSFECLVSGIGDNVVDKCRGLTQVDDNPTNRELLSNWNLQPILLTL